MWWWCHQRLLAVCLQTLRYSDWQLLSETLSVSRQETTTQSCSSSSSSSSSIFIFMSPDSHAPLCQGAVTSDLLPAGWLELSEHWNVKNQSECFCCSRHTQTHTHTHTYTVYIHVHTHWWLFYYWSVCRFYSNELFQMSENSENCLSGSEVTSSNVLSCPTDSLNLEKIRNTFKSSEKQQIFTSVKLNR